MRVRLTAAALLRSAAAVAYLYCRMLDTYEDPADVYRIRLPPRARLRVSVVQRFGDADVAAFTRSARSIDDDEQLIGRSRSRGSRKDTLSLVNPSRRSRHWRPGRPP